MTVCGSSLQQSILLFLRCIIYTTLVCTPKTYIHQLSILYGPQCFHLTCQCPCGVYFACVAFFHNCHFLGPLCFHTASVNVLDYDLQMCCMESHGARYGMCVNVFCLTPSFPPLPHRCLRSHFCLNQWVESSSQAAPVLLLQYKSVRI